MLAVFCQVSFAIPCAAMEKLVLQNADVYDFHSFLSMFLVKRIHRVTRAVVMVSPDRWQNAYLPESAVLQIFACTSWQLTEINW